MRLRQAQVLAILERGKRVRRADFEVKMLLSPLVSPGNAQIAISVPKRFLRAAVARNRMKRLVREVFRSHPVATVPLGLHISYTARDDGKRAKVREQLRRDLSGLFDKAMSLVPNAYLPERVS